MAILTNKLYQWYKENKRVLPWRDQGDPYKIWLSEIILQQTQVLQGLSYYQRFVDRYPTVKQLAEASQEEILKLWQGLGYYSRARNLHQAAQTIVRLHNGHFPKDYKSIRELKGVGDYTAAAIASMAFGLPYATVDGNVFRVLARLYGLDQAINTTKGKHSFTLLANELLDKERPGMHNQAFMEFGALQCLPKSPNCLLCVVREHCWAYKHRAIERLPVKLKKIKQRIRYFNYIYIVSGQTVLVQQRQDSDIWKGLYQFPLIESEVALLPDQLTSSDTWEAWFGDTPLNILSVSEPYKHQLTHQRIYARFYYIELSKFSDKLLKQFECKSLNEFEALPVPRLIEKYFDRLSKS